MKYFYTVGYNLITVVGLGIYNVASIAIAGPTNCLNNAQSASNNNNYFPGNYLCEVLFIFTNKLLFVIQTVSHPVTGMNLLIK